MRRFGSAAVAVLAVLAVGCGGDGPAPFSTLITLDDASPGDIIGLRSEDGAIEFLSRRTGQVMRIEVTDEPDRSIDAARQTRTADVIAEVEVGTDGEQRGLLGHAVIDGRRFLAYTEADTLDLVVGEVAGGTVARIVWNGTSTGSKALGGHLEVHDGRLLLGLGELTGWGRDNGSGALVSLDPDGSPDQEPIVVSSGWNNPFAFTVVSSGEIWIADNAPDGSDLPVAEREGERLGVVGGSSLVEPPPQRAPSAVVELPDGRIGVCGFVDGELRAYRRGDDGAIERAGTIGPCRSGAVVAADGSVITVASDGDDVALLRRPGTD